MFFLRALREVGILPIGSFPRIAFLVMFSGVVIAPLILFAIGGRDTHLANQPSILWSLLVILLFLLLSVGAGILRFMIGFRPVMDNSIGAGGRGYV